MRLNLATLAAALTVPAMVSVAATVPVPKITPLPVTPSSRPFLAAGHLLQPMDLSKSGYTEMEFLVSGKANVYNWAPNGDVTVKTAGAPYTTRILVRRPSSASKFSGTVVVELMNPARKFDWGMMWGYLHEYLMDRGDAWVGITMPGSIAGLKKFDPARYASLSFANPNPREVCPAPPAEPPARGGRGRAQATPPPAPLGPFADEDGLRFDMFSQVAAALKSAAQGMPFSGFRVERVYMTTQIGDLETYIDAIHSRAALADGKPAYDGYLIKNPSAPAKIRNCGSAVSATDARAKLKDINVPVVTVVAQGEIERSLPFMKNDSDAPGGRYRKYEIATAAHIDRYAYDEGFPSFADQKAAVGSAQGSPEWPFNAMCDPPIPLSTNPLLKYSYDAGLMNLDEWVHKGVAPPKQEPLFYTADEKFAPTGGVRSPWADVPTATWYTSSNGPGTCGELGHAVPYPSAKIHAMYPSEKDYAKRVDEDVDKLVKERFFTAFDGKKIKAGLAAQFPK